MSFLSDFIESNGERFIKADYNGISILIREKDGFINATKIAKDNGKQEHLIDISNPKNGSKYPKFSRKRIHAKNGVDLKTPNF